MPVHQITVVPVSKGAAGDRSSRNRKNSKENEVHSAPHRAVQTRPSLPSYPAAGSPGNLLQSRDRRGTQNPPENTLDPTPLTKSQVKRHHRRRLRTGGCVSKCTEHSGSARARDDSSSGEEPQRREARSWSREKARRRRRRRVLGQPPQDEAPTGRGYEGPQGMGADGERANDGQTEQPITKTYEEQEAGDDDMAAPSGPKCTGASGQNGATQQVQTDDELEVCRICHCEGDQECPLIAPCRCTGTLRFVHHACLRQWIKSSDTHCCELCKYDFVMETHLKPLHKWENLQMSSSERRKIFCSVTFHLVSVACVVWSLYILTGQVTKELRQSRGSNGSLDLSSLAESGLLDWLFWTKFCMVAGSLVTGLVFMYVQGKVYLQLWRRLKAFNRVIFVQNCPDSAHDGAQTGAPTGSTEAEHV